MRVLVLRPEEQGRQSAKALGLLGHEAVLAPLFVLRATDEAPPDGPFAALVVTSGNAVPFLAKALAPASRMLPLFAVGDRTAVLAREAGFSDARSAGGDRHGLFELIAKALPKGAHLLLATGENRHADLPDWLREAGFPVCEWRVYSADDVKALPEAAHEALAPRNGLPVDAVLHYSPRGAATFLRLSDVAGLAEAACCVAHVCLSPEVARPLQLAGASAVHVTEHPDEASLFSVIGLLQARNAPAVDARTDGESKNPSTPDLPMSKKPRPLPSSPATAGSAAVASAAGETVATSGTSEPVIETAAGLPSEAVAAPAVSGMPPDEIETAAAAVVPLPIAPAKSGFGGLALALAGLLGGLTGAGAMIYAPRLLPASMALPDPTAGLAARLDALQKQTVTRDAIEAVDRKATVAEALAAKSSAEIAALGQRVAAQPQGAAVAPENAARITEANRQITELTARLGKAEDATRMIAQDAARQATEQAQKIALSQGAAASVPARLVLAERIQRAIAGGQPFAADLKALASLLPSGAGSMAALEAVAAKGAPTQAALLEQFRQVRGKLSEDTTAASASLTERLMAMADNVVKVRAVGAAGGTSPGALTQSIEVALSRGDMAAGLAAFAQLPEPARRAGEALAGGMKLRLDSASLARKLADDAVSALGVSK